MAQEVTVAKESGVKSLNAQGAAKRENPFRNIKTSPISDAYRRELEEQGVNIRMVESMRKDERDRRIDDEYETQVRNLKLELREKYPLGNYANPSLASGMRLQQANLHRAAYNRELAQGIKRLRRLASEAKRK